MAAQLELNWPDDALYLHLREGDFSSNLDLIESQVICDLGKHGELLGVEIVQLWDFLYSQPRKQAVIDELSSILRSHMGAESEGVPDYQTLELSEAEAERLLAAIVAEISHRATYRMMESLQELETLNSLPRHERPDVDTETAGSAAG